MARSGSNRRKRNNRITVRFDDDEFNIAINKADKAGLCPSALLRQLVLDDSRIKSARITPQRKKDASQLIGLLGQNAEALRSYSKIRNISPDDPFLTAIWRDLSEITVLCFEILGRKP